MSPPRLQVPGVDDDTALRQLETLVLTQVRDNMSLMNTNMQKMNDQLAQVKESVTVLTAQDFSAQIARLEVGLKTNQEAVRAELQRQVTVNTEDIRKLDNRINNHAVQMGRYGMGMAIAAVASGSALTAVIATMVPRIMGVH